MAGARLPAPKLLLKSLESGGGTGGLRRLCADGDREQGVVQGWQGRGGSPTRAPRPTAPGEISDPRPATPSDPGRCDPAQSGSQRLT